MRLIGAVAPGESVPASEATDGLATLNRMLDSWSNESLIIHAPVREVFSITASDGSYTMGTGGNFDTPRPIGIDRVTVKKTSGSTVIEYPVRIIRNAEEWSRIRQKELLTPYPEYVYLEETFPLTTLNLYPVPSASDSLVIYSRKPLSQVSTIAADLSLPPGYSRAIIFNLAIDLAPEYGRSTSQEVASIAMESKAAIKRTNDKPGYLRVDSALTSKGGFNIFTGENN